MHEAHHINFMPRDSKNKFIGVFDSGLGGLNILRAIAKEIPDYNYIYLGDTARLPYGARSKEVIYEFTKQAIDFLFDNNCELIILACNTVSSDALHKIQQEYLPEYYPDKKVLGVLVPAAEEAIEKTINGKIGVIATEGTVKSGAFIRELAKLNPKIKVFQEACPLLVPIIEEGKQDSKITEPILMGYLRPLINKKIDTLILGCTHYDILENKIRKIVGPRIKIISEARIVPKKLRNYLQKHQEIEEKIDKSKIIRFYSTDLTAKFKVLGSKFFGRNINVKKVRLN